MTAVWWFGVGVVVGVLAASLGVVVIVTLLRRDAEHFGQC